MILFLLENSLFMKKEPINQQMKLWRKFIYLFEGAFVFVFSLFFYKHDICRAFWNWRFLCFVCRAYRDDRDCRDSLLSRQQAISKR